MRVFQTLLAANRYAKRAYKDGWRVSIERDRSVSFHRPDYVVRCAVLDDKPYAALHVGANPVPFRPLPL